MFKPKKPIRPVLEAPVSKMDTETRALNHAKVLAEISQFMKDELDILKRTDANIEDAMIRNLAYFNLASLCTQDGELQLSEMCIPKQIQLTILRLIRLDITMTHIIGLDCRNEYLWEFYKSVMSYSSDVRPGSPVELRVRTFVERHPYCWMFPFIQTIYSSMPLASKP